MPRHTYTVSGMACGGCEDNVTDAVLDVGGVSAVEADHDTDSVAVDADSETQESDIVSAIEQAGYEVVEG